MTSPPDHPSGPTSPATGPLAPDDDLADGGQLSTAGRRAAIGAALPLLATYFADAPTWTLETQTQLHTATPSAGRQEVDDLAAALRLRAGLAAAQRLLSVLRRITARPTFRYTQTASESVGAIRGRLDLARYSRSRGRLDVPRRYPVRQVTREEATPENILAAYAAQWIDRDLGATPSRLLPAKAPERRQLDATQLALRNATRRPGLAGATEQAQRVWRRGGLEALLDRVDARLGSGRVSPAPPYQELTDWVRRTVDRQALADPGEIEWAFYDGRFDTKLFEIWCLQQLATALTTLLGPAISDPPVLARRGTQPLFSWHTGAGVLHLHFQPSLGALCSRGVIWRFQPENRPLAGYPDLAITATRVDGTSGLALLDPKLRQRRGAPTEEIYKLLGYFAHLDLGARALGAIIYYSPGVARRFSLSSAGGGVVEAVALDPADTTVSASGIDRLSDLALRTTGLDPATSRRLISRTSVAGDSLEEEVATIRQALAVEAMAAAAAALPPGTLGPTRKSTAASLHDVWTLLSDQTQTMLVTAEYFGNQAPDGADHSGPMLGLAAAVERVLHEGFLQRAAAVYPGQLDLHQTFGGTLHLLSEALGGGRKAAGATALAAFLEHHPEVDRHRLQQLLDPAKQMNRSYRIPAAHRDVVNEATWIAGRAVILQPPTDLLRALTSALATAGN